LLMVLITVTFVEFSYSYHVLVTSLLLPVELLVYLSLLFECIIPNALLSATILLVFYVMVPEYTVFMMFLRDRTISFAKSQSSSLF
jgi:hypothetical protein